MSRTTDAAVKNVLMEDYDSLNTPNLTGFIDTASAVVDRVVSCATKRSVALSSTESELIERWLAAHFYVCSDQPFSSKNTGRASGSFQGQTGMRFEGSKYGQAAMTIDPSGCLRAIQNNARVQFGWLGKADSEKLSYQDRNGSP